MWGRNNIKKQPIKTNMNVFCDECKFEFKIKPSRVRTKFVTDEVEKMYFKCPKCKKEYVVSYRDNEIRENIARIVSITEQVRKSNGKLPISELEALQNEYEGLKERNLELSNRYIAMFK